MSRQDANANFALTSFLYGGNAAYIEDLYARYEADPKAVDADWQAFFAEPEGRRRRRRQERATARPGSGRTGHCRRRANSSPRSTATGREVGEDGRRQGQGAGAGARRRDLGRRRAAGDARLDPRHDADPRLSHARPFPRRSRSARPRAAANDPELDPRSYGFTEADLDRKIFIDKVLGLEFATMREIVAILQRTYCQTLGVEFMHISDPAQKGWLQERIEGPRQGDQLHPRGQARDPQQAGRGRRLREILRPEIHRHQALRPRRRRIDDPGAGADHQARRRARRARRSSSAWRIAAGSTCWRR